MRAVLQVPSHVLEDPNLLEPLREAMNGLVTGTTPYAILPSDQGWELTLEDSEGEVRQFEIIEKK